MNVQEEIKKRRTFAIISHPDAGKTTITEQLLYFGGEIREAGTVKGKKTGNFAKSDWMDIEKQRGISVTSSVMQFDYDGKRVNILVESQEMINLPFYFDLDRSSDDTGIVYF